MSTTNLNLELIETADTIKNGFLAKVNANMQKIDTKYGQLKNGLLEQTGKSTLEEAIAEIDDMSAEIIALESVGNAVASEIASGKKALVQGVEITGTNTFDANTSDANATAEDIISTKTAYVQGQKITGSRVIGVELPTVNITLTGDTTYMGYISGYGWGMDDSGRLIIWAMSSSAPYEHISFSESSIVGTAENGWAITSFDTGDPTSVPYACTITGLSEYSTINIELNANYVNSTYDYVRLSVTLTTE